MKKIKRKLLAVLLTFAMLFGSSMTVFAQDYEWQNLQVGNELQNGDTISVTYATITSINTIMPSKVSLYINDQEIGTSCSIDEN